MNIYRTADLEASIRHAHEGFTHVILDRSYHSLFPVPFRTGNLNDLPLYMWAPWLPNRTAVDRWEAAGGVLIAQDRASDVPCDVLLFVECPFSVRDIHRYSQGARDAVVVPVPNWRTHADTLDIKHPPVDVLEGIQRALLKFSTRTHPVLEALGWESGFVCTDNDIAEEIGLPLTTVQYMHRGFRPRDVYLIQKRVIPDARDPLRGVYERLKPVERKRAIPVEMRKAVKELDKLGHIRLSKYRVFPDRLQDWKQHKRARERHLKDLAEVQSLVETLPIHPQT